LEDRLSGPALSRLASQATSNHKSTILAVIQSRVGHFDEQCVILRLLCRLRLQVYFPASSIAAIQHSDIIPHRATRDPDRMWPGRHEQLRSGDECMQIEYGTGAETGQFPPPDALYFIA
jgi:hypothetical protein